MRHLPGETLVQQGLVDFLARRHTVPACLVQIARARLTEAGLIPKDAPPSLPDPELELYRLLRKEKGDAYSRYNALIRELVSFEQALERTRKRPVVSGQ